MSVEFHRQRIQAQDSQVPIILVVEDEEDNLLFISHALILLGYSFITAKNGKEAWDLASKYQVDLVLIDLVLPDINGFDLVSRLKQNKFTQEMFIVATSALVREEDRERAMKAGCDDYLLKPYFIEELERKIRQYLPQSFFTKMPFWKIPRGRQYQLADLFC